MKKQKLTAQVVLENFAPRELLEMVLDIRGRNAKEFLLEEAIDESIERAIKLFDIVQGND